MTRLCTGGEANLQERNYHVYESLLDLVLKLGWLQVVAPLGGVPTQAARLKAMPTMQKEEVEGYAAPTLVWAKDVPWMV